MSNLLQSYFNAIDSLFSKIRATQADNIEAAAKLIADTVAGGGCVYVYDTGHIINSELLNRAGGPVFIRKFSYGLSVESHARPRDRSGINTSQEGLAGWALRCSSVLPGDLFIIGSVSGKTANVIDLAIEAKKFGCKLITVSSHEYSSQLASQHSSGKRLFELGDVNIDNCAPFGDAMLEVEGLEAKLAPASGLSAAYIMWAVIVRATELLIACGKVPSILKSVNYPPNVEYNNKLYKRYEQEGL
ncbi:MAG TPA: sugar isomerase domain-containing protein [Bacillota bacterium]|nr:sugar isomerase domain-containing protein [Clostridiales bacterium]HPT84432.1 sugar isomerase domain-containing protein [Bacillota bacterium]